MSGAAGNPVEFADMQGLLRFSHAHLSHCRLLLLQVEDAGLARAWLGEVPVATAEKSSPRPQRVAQLGFTAQGLAALQLDSELLAGFPEEYLAGVAGDDNRSRRLGDTGSNGPGYWRWGGHGNVGHVLVMLYADPEGLDAWQAELCDARFEAAFSVLHQPPDSRIARTEPFGFADGISQPRVDWEQALELEVGGRADYRHEMALGELALGYRNEYGLFTDRPLVDPATDAGAGQLAPAIDAPALRDFGRNGSYLVIRQLSQDVSGFRDYLQSQSEDDPAAAESLAAAMVGRQRDGMPLAELSPGAAGDRNDFDYDADPQGRACPFAAHVRRANPRTGDFPPHVGGPLSRLWSALGFGRRHPGEDLVASTRFHRLVRRGRVFEAGDEQGLQFMCLNANIARQFEFVQAAWIASGSFAGLREQADPLLGSRDPQAGGLATDQFHDTRTGAGGRRLKGLPQFVTLQGGGYYFLPGIRALRYIVDGEGERRA